MPRNRNRTRRNNNVKRGGMQNNGPRSAEIGTRQKVARLSGTDDMATVGVTFPINSTTPSPGFIIRTTTTGLIGDTTAISGTYVPVAPGTLGERLASLGDCYSEYRVRRLRLRHRPLVSTVNTQTTETLNATAGDKFLTPDFTAVVGWVQDPEYTGSIMTPSEVLNYSAKRVDMAKAWSFVVRPRDTWKYQPVPSDNFSTANSSGDLRTMFTGNLLFLWNDANNLPVIRTGSASGGGLYVQTGSLEIDWEIDFRYPADPDLTTPTVALTPVMAAQLFLKRARVSKHVEEKKENLTTVSSSSVQSTPGRWF